MLKKLLFIGVLIFVLGPLYGQEDGELKAGFLKRNVQIFPGKVVNLPVTLENTSGNNLSVQVALKVPTGWKAIINMRDAQLKPLEKKMLIFSVQSSNNAVVGDFEVEAEILDQSSKTKIGSIETLVQIKEYENISMSLAHSSDYIKAGEILKSSVSIQNKGNTKKKVYLEVVNCEVEGGNEVEVEPGQSVNVKLFSKISEEVRETYKGYFSVRALLGEKVYENVYHTYLIFPSENQKKDLYFRYPITTSASYIYTNTSGEDVTGYQLEAFGSGYLDTERKHFLEFLTRGPNNQELGFMGLYDQYYINYKNDFLNVTVGEQAYLFTELTEMSRYGFGAESRFKLKNGLRFGAVYVQPRFYDNIHDEIAAFAGFEFNKDNWLDLYYVTKNTKYSDNDINLVSFSGNVVPFKNTTVGFELAGGHFEGKWDKAYKLSLNTQLSIFQMAGNYYSTGEDFPGYYNNSKFYSANVTARLSKKLSLGVYAREDFQNAQLDTFFVTAPYSKSYQAILNYNVARRANFKLFWRDYERKDRLSQDQFHYKTQSINSQFSHRVKSLDYNLLGEYGKTTNFQLGETENEQNTFRVYANMGYDLNGLHFFRLFGSWSNVNSFITDEQRDLTWGASISSAITKNLRAMLYFQNAYNIEDYYQNRNLMQATLDYSFLRNHKISLRSFYTLFQQETEDPDLSAAVTYTYKLGVPLKQVVMAGDLKGSITYPDGTPVEGVIFNLLNKKSISDKNGEFVFNTVEPGQHLLFADTKDLGIDEISSVPLPAKIEILGNEVSVLNIQILKGSRFAGKFLLSENDQHGIAANIVVEISSVFDQFRIVTNGNGEFSFPMLRPGSYKFKIYSNSLPEGYSVAKNEFLLELQAGENKDFEIALKKRVRNIIFNSNDFVLTPSTSDNIVPDFDTKDKEEVSEQLGDYYSIQIGAFKRQKTKGSRYHERTGFDFEQFEDGFYKYFIGRFNTLNNAKVKLAELQEIYRNPFIVKLKGDKGDKPIVQEYNAQERFYSVQVGAFRSKKTNDSKYFSQYPFDFEEYSNNLNKYFIGKFTTVEDAKKLQTELSRFYRNPFVVIFEKGKIRPVH